MEKDILHWEQLEGASTASDIHLSCNIVLYNLCTTGRLSVALLKIPVRTLHGQAMQQKQINGLVKGLCFPENALTFHLKCNVMKIK